MTSDEAKQFIFTRTGEPPDVTQRFLERRFRYKELNGVAQPSEDLETEREQHHNILLLDWGMYACFRGWADEVIQAEDASTKARTHQLRIVKS